MGKTLPPILILDQSPGVTLSLSMEMKLVRMDPYPSLLDLIESSDSSLAAGSGLMCTESRLRLDWKG